MRQLLTCAAMPFCARRNSLEGGIPCRSSVALFGAAEVGTGVHLVDVSDAAQETESPHLPPTRGAALGEGCFLGTAGLVLRRQTCPRVRALPTADSRHNLRRDGAAARPVLVRAGHAVGDVDPRRRDAERGEGVTLWVRFLFIAGDAGASEFEHHHRRGCRLASRHRDCSPNQSYGTRCPGRPRDWPLVKDGVGRGSSSERSIAPNSSSSASESGVMPSSRMRSTPIVLIQRGATHRACSWMSSS